METERHEYAPCATIAEDETGPYPLYGSLEGLPEILPIPGLPFRDHWPGLTVWNPPIWDAVRIRPEDVGTYVCSFWKLKEHDYDGYIDVYWSEETFLGAPPALTVANAQWLHEWMALFQSAEASMDAATHPGHSNGWQAYAVSQVALKDGRLCIERRQVDWLPGADSHPHLRVEEHYNG